MLVEDQIGHVEVFEQRLDTVMHDIFVDVAVYEDVIACCYP